MEQQMGYHGAPEINSCQLTETEQAVVEATEALVVETVKLLSRGCPPESLQEAAREDLLALKPCLEEALDALEGL